MAAPFTAELTSRAIIAPGIAELELAMRDPPRLEFKAGQFVSVGVTPPAEASAPELATENQTIVPRRSYSIASQSDAGERLRFIIRVIPEGKASQYLMGIPLGATVPMTGPHGFFVLAEQHPGDIVFGATGTGMAAVMPMLGELARRPRQGAHKRIVLWGLRHQSDLFARQEIETLVSAAGATLEVFLTAPDPTWAGGRGRITSPLVERLPELAAPTFYLVGNGAMITEVKRELVARGVNRKTQIRTEAFFD